jgi:hypothetical protein
MEQRRKDIEALTRTHGYTEEEAEVVYHLKMARDRLAALHRRRFEEERPGPQAYVDPHFHALYAVLDGWVLERDYPDRVSRPRREATDE